jgi:hypothetical protein
MQTSSTSFLKGLAVVALLVVTLLTYNHHRNILSTVQASCTACMDVGFCSAECVACPAVAQD